MSRKILLIICFPFLLAFGIAISPLLGAIGSFMYLKDELDDLE